MRDFWKWLSVEAPDWKKLSGVELKALHVAYELEHNIEGTIEWVKKSPFCFEGMMEGKHLGLQVRLSECKKRWLLSILKPEGEFEFAVHSVERGQELGQYLYNLAMEAQHAHINA